MSVSIYTLSCPISGEIKYVGSTTHVLKHRLSQHLGDPTNERNAEWFLDLKSKGLIPIISLIELAEETQRKEREAHWIKKHLEDGCRLNNSDRRGKRDNDIFDITLFSKKVLENRLRLNLTQRQLSEKIHVGHYTISRVESSRNLPDVDSYFALCGWMKLTTDYFVKKTKTK